MTSVKLIDTINLLKKAKDAGIKISFDNNELIIQLHKEKEIDSLLLNELRDHKPYLIAYLKDHSAGKQGLVAEKKIVPIHRSASALLPLSFSQERLWFIDQMEGSAHYNIAAVLRLKGHLNRAALAYALQTIVSRHEVLRTVIVQPEGIPYQQVQPDGQWQLVVTDDPIYKTDAVALQSHIAAHINAPFDLCRDHMLRAGLVVLGEAEHLLVISMHHIASDGWSVGIIVRELGELYESYIQKRPVQLANLEIQYADYAIWQRNWLSGELLKKHADYWKDKLWGVQALQLPVDYPRPPVQSTRGAVHTFSLDRELSDQLRALSAREGTTLFMTLLAAFQVLLYRYSGQEDICIGSPIAGRRQQQVGGLIGFFINTLALRCNLSNNLPFTALLQEVKETTLNAYDHQDLPFEKIVEVVAKERDVSRSPLFQVMFVMQNLPAAPDLRLGDLLLTQESMAHTTAMFDLTLSMHEQDAGLSGSIEYCIDLFNTTRIDQMASHFEQLLKSVVKEPATPVNSLAILSVAAQKELLVTFNDTAIAYVPDKTIIDLFAQQVALAPAATALMFEGKVLTYEMLDKRSSQLANYLLHKGVKAETLVPVCIERSFEMIVGILGILKAGGAYVPIDPDYPQERIAYMLEDTGASLMVSSSACRLKLPAVSDADIISLDSDWSSIDGYSEISPASALLPGQLAYVIYTSGSTGKPKGVMIEHKGVVNLAWSQCEALQLKQGTRSMQFASFGFDAACYEIFNTILSGGTLVLPTQEDLLSVEKFALFINEYQIELLTLPPSYQHIIKELLGPVKTIVSAGEALNRDDGRFIASKGVRLINAYGPTENSVCTSLTDCPINADNVVVIGKPIANVQMYVLNKYGQLCPVGITGEICVAGAGLARGYLNRPDLTADKFVANPFSQEWGGRMYKTGDLGRWLPDGTVEYLGRVDDQVKIRGYRIELGEIESVLQECEQVRQAVVLAPVANKENAASRQLVGYIVPDGSFDRAGILSYLKRRLPEYMVPSILISLEALPLTASGKVDRKALPDPDAGALPVNEYIAPRTQLEYQLVNIWQDILGAKQVGINDNFFELGGHSLLAMRMVAVLGKEQQVKLSVKSLFLHPTIAQLAIHIQQEGKHLLLPAIEAHPYPSHIPLSYSQERLWFIDQLEGTIQYHIPAILQLKGNLNQQALEHALRQIVNRHEVLRTVLIQQDEERYQQIMDKDQWQLTVIDEPACRDHAESLHARIAALIEMPFVLSEHHMLRGHLIVLGKESYVLILTMHHIASDGWSTGVIVRELAELYSAGIENRIAKLPFLDIQYADYAIWQRKYLSGPGLKQHLDYWKDKLTGVTMLQLPADHRRPLKPGIRGASSSFMLDKELSGQLRKLSLAQGTTLYMTMLAAFKVLLYRYSGQTDICIGCSIAGRQQPETAHLAGFFVNALPLRSDLGHDPSFISLLQQVKQTTLDAYEYQEVPFEKIVETVAVERNVSQNPLFQVLFVLQNIPAVPVLHLGEITLSEELSAPVTAQFDLNVSIADGEEGLGVSITYRTDLYSNETINRMGNHFRQLLTGIVSNPDQTINTLSILTTAEEQQLLLAFNDTTTGYLPGKDKTIVDLFETQAALTPEAIALVSEEVTITYRQLSERSGQLANYLRSVGVKTETLVPVCFQRSVEMVVGILGILKAGGAYVPVDPDFPAARISHILADTGAAVILGSKACEAALPATNARIIFLEDIPEEISVYPSTLTANPPLQKHLAYVIYTSGSTGIPKGVMIEHGSLVNYLLNSKAEYINREGTLSGTFLHLSYTFDASLTGMFMPLLYGKSIVVGSGKQAAIFESPLLWKYAPYDFIKLTPAHLPLLEAAMSKASHTTLTKKLVLGGEALLPAHIQFLLNERESVEIVNEYGPTEATVGCSTYRLHTLAGIQETGSSISIGKPIDNVQLYIVDTSMNLVPVGVTGEICIGGDGLARGYLNREALTAEKFIPNPFSRDSDTRIYKTGDAGRWLPDGNIEYLGRIDEQVKIRGYRVEPGEIESVLQQCDLVSQAAVLATDSNVPHQPSRLLAYIVPKGDFYKEAMLAYMRERLPEYMIPEQLIEMETLPLTSNGKIDRKSLPHPETYTSLSDAYTAPRTALETSIANIWASLLELERIGIYDDLFKSGGHSLLAIRLVSVIRKELGLGISITDIFDYPTVASLCAMLEQRDQQNAVQATAMHSEHILLLNKSDQEFPLFVLPGSGGVADGYDELGRALNDTGRVYGLQMMGAFEGEQPLDNIPAIAAQNIIWMKQIQREGPYRFIGHSFGSFVAYEMAKQLEANGEVVAAVVVLDTAVKQGLGMEKKDDLGVLLYGALVTFFEQYNIINKPYPQWITLLREEIVALPPREIVSFMKEFMKDKMNDKKELTNLALRVLDLEINSVFINYKVTGKINAPVMVVKAAASEWGADGHSLGWERHAPDVTVITTSGDHHTMLKKGQVHLLAGALMKQFKLA